MTGAETARLISALEREYPSRRNDELTDEARAERLLIWAAALQKEDYPVVMRALPELFSGCRWFPKLPEVLDAVKKCRPDPLDVMAERCAEYRAAFPDWTHDGLQNGQRLAKLEEYKRLGEGGAKHEALAGA